MVKTPKKSKRKIGGNKMLSVKFKEQFKINLPTGEIYCINPGTVLENCSRVKTGQQRHNHIMVRFVDDNGIARSFVLCLDKDGNAVEIINDGEKTMYWNFLRNDTPVEKKMFYCGNCGKVITLLKGETSPTHCQHCGYEAKNTVEGGTE